jgi:hypothetical protein
VGIGQYFQFYNTERPHQALAYRAGGRAAQAAQKEFAWTISSSRRCR